MLSIAVAGAPLKTPSPGGTIKGLEYAHSLGITAMELEWVQNVPGSVERMEEIRTVSEKHKMYLTVHAPYYVNLNTPDEAKLEASKLRVLKALTMGELAGAHSVCVHAAFYLGNPPEAAYDNICRATESILKQKKKFFPHVNLAFETMGKPSQFGTLEECLKISKEFGIYPCLDPAHMHARSNGAVNTTKEWEDMFDLYVTYLGKESLKEMHLHYSGIAYGAKGEKHHLPLEESDANWKDFLKVLKKYNVGGSLVCESPAMEEDTLLLQKTFLKL